MNASPDSPRKLFVRPSGARFCKSLLGPLLLILILVASRAAFAAVINTYTVTDTSDDVADTGSLRYALSEVNADASDDVAGNYDVINFSGVTGTITVGSTLPISKSVTINGPGANVLAISGNDAVGVFQTAGSAANVTISGLTITHGRAPMGAGIFITKGAMTVNNCTLSYNTGVASGTNVGAAINLNGGVSLTVNNSTFFSNAAIAGGNPQASGGAIWAENPLVVNNSTFYNNSAVSQGGAIMELIGTYLTIQNSTIVGNTAAAGGGVIVDGLIPIITNSIIAGNTATTGADYYCSNTPARCGTAPPAGNLIGGGTPALGPLQYNGGPTMTMFPLKSGTGIIGAGLNSTLATDQRGVPRPTAGASDLGAVQNYDLVVTTTDDSTNGASTCDGSDTCSLRDALTLANSQGAGDIITVTGLQGTIDLGSPLPDVTTDLNIDGPGANLFTISGGNASPVFNITDSSVTANFSGVTIANGSSSSNGGGIGNSGAILTLSNCALSNNSAPGGASGGGLASLNPAGTTTVTDCTFSGNGALNGGAIYNLGALQVQNSTFSGNTATGSGGTGSGGGIFTQGPATVMSSTVSGNTAGTGGGIANGSGTISVVNSLIAGNTEAASPGDDCSACSTQSSFNLISTAATPVTAAQVMLGPLAYNGLNQTVQTMLPFPGSPAIETGDPTQLPSDLGTDERQLPRTINNKVDLGAVETNYTAIQFVQQPSNTNVNADISPAVTMSVTESGTTVANVPIPITFTGAGVLSGTLTETTMVTSGGGPALASFGDLNGNTPGTGDTLVSTLTITSAGMAPAQTLTATSTPFDIIALPPATVQLTVNPTAPVYGQPVTVTVTVTTTGSVPPTGTVTIYYNGQPIGTGTLGPNGTVIITIPGGTLPVGTDPITVGYSGDGNYGGSTSAPVPVTVTPAAPPSNFTVSSSTGPQTVLPGQNAMYTIPVSPVNGAFNSAVTLSASGLPAGATATFSPLSVTPGASPVPTTMTIQTTKQTAELRQLGSTAPLLLGFLLPLFGLRRGKRKLQRYGLLLLFAVLSIGAITGLNGCSPGGFFGQSPKTYTVTVTGTSGSLQHSTTVTLTVQ